MASDSEWNSKEMRIGTAPTFDATKLERGENPRTWYADGSDAYAERGMVISFQHVPSRTVVSFKAFITAYNEVFSSDWGAETVYGRADPIYMFKNTTRKITLAFKVPAAAESEAFENLERVQKLIQFLYPNYTTVNGEAAAQTISQSPLVRLKLLNLVQKHTTSTSGEGFAAPSFPYSVTRPGGAEAAAAEHAKAGLGKPSTSDPSFDYDRMIKAKQPSEKKGATGGVTTLTADSGLLGVIESLAVNYNLEEIGGFEEGTGVILPKLIDVNITFGAIHEHVVGWTTPSPADSATVEKPAIQSTEKISTDPTNEPATPGDDEDEPPDPTAENDNKVAALAAVWKETQTAGSGVTVFFQTAADTAEGPVGAEFTFAKPPGGDLYALESGQNDAVDAVAMTKPDPLYGLLEIEEEECLYGMDCYDE